MTEETMKEKLHRLHPIRNTICKKQCGKSHYTNGQLQPSRSIITKAIPKEKENLIVRVSTVKYSKQPVHNRVTGQAYRPMEYKCNPRNKLSHPCSTDLTGMLTLFNGERLSSTKGARKNGYPQATK